MARSKITRVAISILSVIIGAVLGIIFTWTVISSALVPDPCRFHREDSNWFYDLMFDFLPVDLYHPSPSLFNMGLFALIGSIVFYKIAQRLMSK